MSTVPSSSTGLSLPLIKGEVTSRVGGKILAGAAVEEYKPGIKTRASFGETKLNSGRNKQRPIIYVQALPKVKILVNAVIIICGTRSKKMD